MSSNTKSARRNDETSNRERARLQYGESDAKNAIVTQHGLQCLQGHAGGGYELSMERHLRLDIYSSSQREEPSELCRKQLLYLPGLYV
jgi:hypothetical protein